MYEMLFPILQLNILASHAERARTCNLFIVPFDVKILFTMMHVLTKLLIFHL